MWQGLQDKRLKNGLTGAVFGILVTSFLLYFSFYLYYIYILIPIILVVIFHYSGSWRVSDRAFYGFIAIFIAFLISSAVISINLENTPHSSITTIKNSLGSFALDFNYSKLNQNIKLFFSLNSTAVKNATAEIYDLINARVIENTTLIFSKSGSISTSVLNLTDMPSTIIAIYLNISFATNNGSISSNVGILGPVLVSFSGLWLYLIKDLAIGYLLVTYGFFLIFALLVRFMNRTRERNTGRKGGKLENNDNKNGNESEIKNEIEENKN